MVTPKEVLDAIETFAPFSTAEEWDNSGLLVDCGGSADRIMFCLDATYETINEAKERGCGILVAHHPVIFNGLRNISPGDPAVTAAINGVTVIAAHTNFDAAVGGVNDVLCDLLEIERDGSFSGGVGRTGNLKNAMPAEQFASHVAKRLGTKRVSAVLGNGEVKRVAVMGGAFSGADHLLETGVDALVTGELKHHDALELKRYGVTAVAAGHFATENPGMMAMMEYLKEIFDKRAECVFSEKGKDPLSAVCV